MVKLKAAELLRAAFAKKSWRKETVVFSGVTDCYQPLEASYRLTRACLEVCVAHANPAAIITKSALVERDVDVLTELARVASAFVTVSIPFWDPERARAIEPYVATPARRLRVIETLARAGLQVGVNVAPIIPGLNDQDIPRILAAARDAGATRAGCVLVRLPGSVKQVFEQRLRDALPLVADRVLHRIRETRGGRLYDARFGARGRGEGNYADMIRTLFETTAARLGFERGMGMVDDAAASGRRRRRAGRWPGRRCGAENAPRFGWLGCPADAPHRVWRVSRRRRASRESALVARVPDRGSHGRRRARSPRRWP